MKIALCLSGSTKNNRAEKTINSIVKKYNTNIFIHTWNILDQNSFNQNSWTKNLQNDLEYLKYYKYTKVNIENFDIKKIYLENILKNNKFDSMFREDVGILSMFYSIYQSNLLKREYELNNNIIFDCVIRIRFDCNIVSDFNIEEYDMRNLNIPIGRDWGGLNDQFAFSSSKNMDIYSDVINNLSNLKQFYHPETMLQNHIAYHNIPIKRVDVDARINYE
jgi:hypothetical protein